MTSKLVTLAKILYSRGALSKTTTAPSSWAVVRRIFDGTDHSNTEDDHEQQEQQPVPTTAVSADGTRLGATGDKEEEDRPSVPVASPFATNERLQFSKDYYRTLLAVSPANTQQQNHQEDEEQPQQHQSAFVAQATSLVTAAQERQDRLLNEPELGIPVGDEYLYLAQ
eukprot:CAMPEP_0178794878 /NCGR_PEP_ID=MMETSP0745-20121128/9823_1 /TAXON_ID=913974 /ORGANISM="Nitzschia punctata, Strain CCMP561" /LENGTH=167 /DNA_ID=CAMNT_0020453225 /DNA_START=19 /DNA_END=522 /DNA_ORIENTATION=-